MNRLSLRNKFLIATMGLVMVLGLSVILFVRNTLTQKLLLQVGQKGIFVARHLADSSANYVLTEKTELLQITVNDFLHDDRDIEYLFIQDSHGRVLAHTFQGGFPLELKKMNPVGPGQEYSVRPLVIGKNDILDIAAPLMKGAVGQVHVGMSEEKMRESISDIIKTIMVIIIAVLIIGGGLAVMLSIKITRPLSELIETAQAIGDGNLERRARIKTKDELGELGIVFNTMIENLKKTTVSKEYVDEIIGSMRDALIVVSPDGAISRMNMAACFLLGYGETELVGEPITRVIPDEPGPECPTLAMVLNNGSVSAVEKTYLAKSGKKVPVLFSASVMRDKESRIQGVVCVAQDITSRKRTETQVKAYSEELREINEELKNFAYIVSHDLRAPLVNIKGFSDELGRSLHEIEPCFQKHLPMLEEEEKEKIAQILHKDVPEALHFIKSSVNRMDDLIDAILKLSRAGRRRLNPEPVSAHDLVQNILRSLAHQIGSRHISVAVNEMPVVVADKTALEQIFGNLLDNAVKYLDPGRNGEIDLSAERSDREIVFHVRDNGRGIAQEDIPKAFEIFRRVGRQDVPGEGMGLAYVKTLIRLQGGRIWCESEIGSGTTFSFALPQPVRTSRYRREGQDCL